MAAHMGTTVSTKKNSLITLSRMALVCLLPTVGLGAEIGGGVQVGVSQTDNIRLATSPNEIEETIFQVSPFINIIHQSPNLDATVDYAFDWYRYADLKTTSRYHRGMASLIGRAWQDSVETELGVGRAQTLADPNAVIPPSRLARSDNLVDKDKWWFNPRLVRNLGNAVTLNANYQYSRIQYDDIQVRPCPTL